MPRKLYSIRQITLKSKGVPPTDNRLSVDPSKIGGICLEVSTGYDHLNTDIVKSRPITQPYSASIHLYTCQVYMCVAGHPRNILCN